MKIFKTNDNLIIRYINKKGITLFKVKKEEKA